jgi:hypothetical protein
MQTLRELQRRPAPGARPQPLALFEGALWVGSWEPNSLYEPTIGISIASRPGEKLYLIAADEEFERLELAILELENPNGIKLSRRLTSARAA